MKVLLIHNYYRSRLIGGEDVAFKRELIALRRRLGRENVIEYTVSSDQLNSTYLISNILFSFRHFFHILKEVRNNKIEIIHCHNYFPLLSFSIFLAARIAGAKTILTLHNFRLWCPSGYLYRSGKICHDCVKFRWKLPFPGIRYKCYHNSFFRSIILAMSILIYRQHFRFVDFFITLTPFQSNFLISNKLLPASKIRLKPNFYAPTKVGPIEYTREFDLIFIGKLETQKGVEELVNVFKSQLYNKKLLMIGNGPLLAEIQAKKTENITLLDSVDPSQIPTYIARSLYLIQPSLWYETFGLTIIEAMSIGVPVLGYPIGTRLDLIENGKNGFFLNREDLGTSILQCLNVGEKEYNELQENSKSFAERFKEERVIEKQINLYAEIVK